MNATSHSSIVLCRFLKTFCMCGQNIVISFRLTAILHQRHLGHNHKDAQANASVRAAFVHALGDVFQSISVLISALIIYFKVCLSNNSNSMNAVALAACVCQRKPLYKVKTNKFWNLNIPYIPKSCLFLLGFESFKKIQFDMVLRWNREHLAFLDVSNG